MHHSTTMHLGILLRATDGARANTPTQDRRGFHAPGGLLSHGGGNPMSLIGGHNYQTAQRQSLRGSSLSKQASNGPPNMSQRLRNRFYILQKETNLVNGPTNTPQRFPENRLYGERRERPPGGPAHTSHQLPSRHPLRRRPPRHRAVRPAVARQLRRRGPVQWLSSNVTWPFTMT